jgi:hypothetical protein
MHKVCLLINSTQSLSTHKTQHKVCLHARTLCTKFVYSQTQHKVHTETLNTKSVYSNELYTQNLSTHKHCIHKICLHSTHRHSEHEHGIHKHSTNKLSTHEDSKHTLSTHGHPPKTSPVAHKVQSVLRSSDVFGGRKVEFDRGLALQVDALDRRQCVCCRVADN